MKKVLYFFTAAALAFIGALALSAFAGPDAEATKLPVKTASVSDFGLYAPSKTATYTWTLDTITNAANDTLTLPFGNILSNYEWAYFVTRTNISGTTNIAVSVQASGVKTGDTDWVQVGVTSATTATNEIVSGTSFHGLRHRIIVDGTGTQSSSYRLTAVMKLKN